MHQLAAVGLKAEYWPSNKLLLEEPELAVNTESCAAFLPEDDQIDVHGAVRSIEEVHFLVSIYKLFKAMLFRLENSYPTWVGVKIAF